MYKICYCMFNAFPRKLVTLKNGRNESRNVFWWDMDDDVEVGEESATDDDVVTDRSHRVIQ